MTRFTGRGCLARRSGLLASWSASCDFRLEQVIQLLQRVFEVGTDIGLSDERCVGARSERFRALPLAIGKGADSGNGVRAGEIGMVLVILRLLSLDRILDEPQSLLPFAQLAKNLAAQPIVVTELGSTCGIVGAFNGEHGKRPVRIAPVDPNSRQHARDRGVHRFSRQVQSRSRGKYLLRVFEAPRHVEVESALEVRVDRPRLLRSTHVDMVLDRTTEQFIGLAMSTHGHREFGLVQEKAGVRGLGPVACRAQQGEGAVHQRRRIGLVAPQRMKVAKSSVDPYQGSFRDDGSASEERPVMHR